MFSIIFPPRSRLAVSAFAKLFSTGSAPFYIPTSNVWGFQFLHILVNTCYYLSFWLAWHFIVKWSGTSLWFWFAFPWWLMMLIPFSGTYLRFAYFLWRNVYLEPLPISKLSCHFIIKPKNSLYILDIRPLSDIWFAKVSPILWIVFSFYCPQLRQGHLKHRSS